MSGGLLDDPRPLWARVADMLVQNLIIAACGIAAVGLAMWLVH